jgi:indolepyruvate ferredoxin oxidoreductase beta subunit
MTGDTKAITILISALGGEGGGVLAGWITNAAVAAGLPVQRTSIPGVAQRTGATTYYLEIFPKQLTDPERSKLVLSLTPMPGRVDILLATELLEATRAITAGFVTPNATRLFVSTHRIYSIDERAAVGDGRIDVDRALEAAKKCSRDSFLVDMAAIAEKEGCHLNAVLLGILAKSNLLPIAPDIFAEVVRTEGIAVEANLRGFMAGQKAIRGQNIPAKEQATTPTIEKAAEILPALVQEIASIGIRRLAEYQSDDYAALYLKRLSPIVTLDSGDYRLSNLVAKYLATGMAYEDVIRVARLKTRATRFACVRGEVKAAPGDIVRVTEYLRPGLEEICAILPPGLARFALRRWGARDRSERKGRSMTIRTSSIWGFTQLAFLARLRRWRPRTFGYQQTQHRLGRWLADVEAAAKLDLNLAAEVAQCATLIKGYGSTADRGVSACSQIRFEIIEPALTKKLGASTATDAITQARAAFRADDSGNSLRKMLSAFTATIGSQSAA